MHPYHALTMRKSSAAPTPAPSPSLNVSAETLLTGVGATQATASFTLNSDGSTTGADTFSPGSWITPVGGSYGSSYWAIVTLTTGTVTTGTTGSRVAIGTGIGWTVTTTGTSSFRRKFVEGTIQIWNAASGGTMVASGTFYLNAEVDNT